MAFDSPSILTSDLSSKAFAKEEALAKEDALAKTYPIAPQATNQVHSLQTVAVCTWFILTVSTLYADT